MMVAGIPKKPLSINALDILLGKYRVAGRSSGIPAKMGEAINFSNDHGIQSHITTFNSLHDIHECIKLMDGGATSGRFGIVFD
jgi:D-arabinose 1-dehydrogenase-like Zn-dependent alcohol dehydrogenase